MMPPIPAAEQERLGDLIVANHGGPGSAQRQPLTMP